LYKIQIVLKELSETHVILKIIDEAKLNSNLKLLKYALQENNELVAIFTASVKTANS